MISLLSFLLAIVLDWALGEPKRWHPLVGFGRWANFVESLFNKDNKDIYSNKRRQNIIKFRGIFAWLLAVAPPSLFLICLIASLDFLSLHYVWQILVEGLLLYFCIAFTSLKQHTLAVAQALATKDLNAARGAVACIVSRNTKQMSPLQVRKAAIESLLENSADAVFAPIFFYVVFGPYGSLIYRLSNTLDAMWGYKNQRFIYYGWFSARVDDLLNFIPARLSALSFCCLGKRNLAMQAWKTQAPHCSSPNAGPVMSAGAGALGLRLGGPAIYHDIELDKPELGFGREPENEDISLAITFIQKVYFLWVALSVIALLAIGLISANIDSP